MLNKVPTGLLNLAFAWYMLNEKYPVSIMQALTYQGMFLLCATSMVSASKNVTGAVRLERVLRSTSFAMALFISFISWVLLIPVDQGGLYTVKNHFFHTLNSVYCLVEILINSNHNWVHREWRYPLTYGIIYVLYNIVLQMLGFSALYPFLDFVYNTEISILVTVLSATLIPFCHIGLCQLHKQIHG